MNSTHRILVLIALALAPLARLHAADTRRPANKPTADSKTAGEAGSLRVRIGGEIGKAAENCNVRFRSAPFDSLPWLRADLTGETVSPYDSVFGHVMRRPYKEYSGDISGRFIEIMALDSHGDPGIHPALVELLATVPRQQRPGGYFCASGEIDWQKPLDAVEGGAVTDKRSLFRRRGHSPAGTRLNEYFHGSKGPYGSPAAGQPSGAPRRCLHEDTLRGLTGTAIGNGVVLPEKGRGVDTRA